MNFVKNDTLKMRILSKNEILKCEFLDKLRIFVPVCDDGFYHHLPYISTGLFRFCCRLKNGYRQIVSCVAHFSI